MRCLPFALAAFLWSAGAFVPQQAGAETHFGAEGLVIDGASLGEFTLEYPELLTGEQKPAHKLAEKTVDAAKATLRYEGGAELDLKLEAGSRLRIAFKNVPADVKHFNIGMHIPIAFSQGGKWKIGESGGDFPKAKPEKPHLFQGHAPSLQITNYEGRSLTVMVPEFSYLQLTDNREWNWDIYHFRCVTPWNPDLHEVVINLQIEGSAEQAKPLVDAFGQSTREEWPGKVHSEDELKADVAVEKAYYAALHPPALDPYGGLPGSGEKQRLQATGFFHVEKKGERWFLVDPVGNVFFHLGLCSVGPGEDYTLIKGREAAYAWLPPREGEFATAFKLDSSGTVLSFHLANQIRKYGRPYDSEEYSERMIARMRQWGFNSIGAFSGDSPKARAAAQFPSVAGLPLSEWEGVPTLPQIGETFDPFDEKTRARIEANFARTLPARADDPLLIGYFIANEPIYENIPHMVPTYGGDRACKRRLVEGLQAKYRTIGAFNAAWGLQAGAFEELRDRVLPVETDAAKADMAAYTGDFLEELFRVVAEAFHRHDSHHLLLGNRLQPGTINNEQLCRIAGKYLDVMSYNYYTHGVDLEALRRIYKWTGGRPMMLSEFYWSAPPESGLSGGRELRTQEERGRAYRNYVEAGASTGFVIGIEWFTLLDQAVTGRWFQGFNGERANTGVLSVADRPWEGMLEQAMKTNYGIYEVLFGERAPYVWDDPRFAPKAH